MATIHQGKRRDKMVMFRLSDAELEEVKRRSVAEGARSMSDWVREQVLSAGDLKTRVVRIEKVIGLGESN
jgi:hypothetical protein